MTGYTALDWHYASALWYLSAPSFILSGKTAFIKNLSSFFSRPRKQTDAENNLSASHDTAIEKIRASRFGAHNAHLRRKVDMLVSPEWRSRVLEDLGGMKALARWDDAVTSAQMRHEGLT